MRRRFLLLNKKPIPELIWGNNVMFDTNSVSLTDIGYSIYNKPRWSDVIEIVRSHVITSEPVTIEVDLQVVANTTDMGSEGLYFGFNIEFYAEGYTGGSVYTYFYFTP